ncbi:MAG TPA: type IV pilus secretin PilQ [Pyrinomonadaceae bacterium]|jgi:type IV pilus assembly protein PilQ
MNFLQTTSVVCRRALFAFVIISSLAFAAFAQKSTQEGCKTYGCAGFVGEPINLKVVNADIRDILNYITEQYGINFVIDNSVKQVPVTVNVNDVPWNIALDSILQSQDLAVQVNGPILRVAEAGKLAKETDVKLEIQKGMLNAAPLYTEFIRLNYACAGSCASQTGFKGGATSSGATSADQGILGVVKKRLSTRGAIEVDSRSNTLIITDVRENIDAIRQLVILLDQAEPQVEIEARIVIASRNFSRDLGVQLSALVLGSNGRAGGFSTLPNPTVTGSGTGTGTGTGSGTGSTTTNPLPPPINKEPNGTLMSQLANTVVGLTTGIFGTAQINLLLTAGEQKGQAKIIATPRVTTLNNRKAEIESGTQIPVVTTQNSGNQTGGAVFTTQYVSVPLRLEVTPQITDLGTVVLDVVTENNSISSTVSVGGVPGINTQRMKTQVTVPDGGTTVVGGALLDTESDDQFRTPGLSRVPILGNLFKRKAVSRVTNEILFFITPRIYRPDSNGNQLPSRVGDGNRTTTILQPVPLGNPESNSSPNSETPTQQQQYIVPIQPAIQPNSVPSTTKQP